MDNLSYKEQLDLVLRGKWNGQNAILITPRTPEILQNCGAENLPMYITKRHIENALTNKTHGVHWHGLTVEQLQQLPRLIQTPLLVADSLTDNRSVVMILDERDKDGNPLQVSIRLSGMGSYDVWRVPSNFITSIYGRTEHEIMVVRLAEENQILYIAPEARGKLLGLDAVRNPTFGKVMQTSKHIDTEKTEPQPAVKKTEAEKAMDMLNTMAERYTRDPASLVQFLLFSARFYNYSARNQILMMQQNPGARFVAPEGKFADMGYKLLPEEKWSPMILIRPVKATYFYRDGEEVHIGFATPEEKQDIEAGRIKTKETIIGYTSFRAYDISQTDCSIEQYPNILGLGFRSEHHAELYDRMRCFAEHNGIAVSEQNLGSAGLYGYFRPSEECIVINSIMGDTAKLTALCHEYGHALLHATSRENNSVQEFEAESLSLLMMQRFGIEPEEASIGYMSEALKNARKEPQFDILKSVSRVVRQADFISQGMRLQDLQREQQVQRNSGLSPQQVNREKIIENFVQGL